MPANYPRESVLIWFRQYPPVTGVGLKRYLDALSAAGQQSTVKPILQDRWPVVGMKPDEQAGILRAYGSIILPDTQRRRLDKLLFQGDDSTARSLAASLGQDYLRLVEARIALAGEKSDAPRLLNQVPARFARDPGLLYERLRWRRRSGHTEGAIEILNAQPPMTSISNPEGWWKERNILARTLIEEKNYKAAYRLAAAHDQTDGNDYADAEWLCGWLALRFLNNPARASEHFVSMYERVKTSISKARAAYWAARAAEALGQAEQSSNWYKIAAQHPKVYYGQLAALKLPSALRIYRPFSVTATSADRARMKEDELVNGIRLAHAAGLDKMRRQLIKAKIETLETPSEYKAFSEILSGMGLRNEAVRVAKKAAGHNIFLDIEAYPKLSRYFSNLDVDEALAHAVIRQESEFDQYAQSPSGAMGLMQLMPSTASYVAKKRGWEHQTSWLTSRPEHNILLGSAYLNNLLNTYNGSYPLVLAAYNAGGSRVNRWLKENGDPRAGQVDWVDWIELIPIYETRNYVQRVMESYVVYNEYMGMRRSR
jgi:soluble lytic murein transglycosylase